MRKLVALLLAAALCMPWAPAGAFAEELGPQPDSGPTAGAVRESGPDAAPDGVSDEASGGLSDEAAPAPVELAQTSSDDGEAEPASSTVPAERAAEGEALVLSDGLYEVRPSVGSGMAVDVSAGSVDPGANVQVWTANCSPAQRFFVEFDEDGYCTLRNVSSGMMLDVLDARAEDGANVQQWPENGNDAQKWRLVQCDGGVKIVSKLSDRLVLDVSGAASWDGGNVQIWSDNGTAAQRFRLQKVERTVEDGLYAVGSLVAPGKTLDVAGASSAPGTNAQTWSDNLTAAQKFFVQYDESTGYYTVKNAANLMCLDVHDGIGADGTNVQFWTENGEWAQSWSFVPDGSGSYVLRSACNGLALDVSGAFAGDGGNVQLWTPNGTDAQRWTLSQADDRVLVEDGLYRIYLASNSWRSVGIENGSLAEQANVEVAGSANVWSQKFEVTTDAEGYSTIVNLASGMALDAAGASTAAGTNVWQWTKNGTDAQKWRIVYRPEGIAFISKPSGLALDVEGASTAMGANIQLWYDNGTSAQAFELVPTDRSSAVEEGAYTLQSLSEGTYVDVTGASEADGARLQLWEGNGSYAQKFKVLSRSGGMAMVNVHSGKWATAQSSGAVVQTTGDDGSGQCWGFVPADESGEVFYVRSARDGRCLDASGGSLALASFDGSDAQKFVMERTSSFKVYLDAGHGENSNGWGAGFDPGAVGSGYREADLTAEFTELLAEELRRRGIEVVSSPERTGIPYWERHESAVELGCSTFVSIHFNAGGGTGVESYVHSYNAASGSYALQDLLHPALAAGMGLADRGEKSAALAVCGGRLPSVLLEMAFIDDFDDMAAYQQRKGQAVLFLAGAIEQASKRPECAWN